MRKKSRDQNETESRKNEHQPFVNEFMDGLVESSMDEVSEADMGKTDKLIKCKTDNPVNTEISGRTEESIIERMAKRDDLEHQKLIQEISGLVEKVKVSNLSLENTTDAQYKFIQNLVYKQTKQHNEKEKVKQSGSWFFRQRNYSKDTDLQPEDVILNQMEIQILAAHQNSILSQARLIDVTIGELYCKLKTSLPRLFVSVTEPIPTKKVHLPSGRDKNNKTGNLYKSFEFKVASASDDANHKREQERLPLRKANDNNDIMLEKEELIRKLEDLKASLQVKNDVYEHLQQQFEETTSEISVLNDQYEDSKSHSLQTAKELATLQREYDTVCQEKKTLEETNLKLKLSVQSLDEALDDTQTKLALLNSELTESKQKCIKITDLTEQNKHLEVKIQESAMECDYWKKRNEEIKLELSQTNLLLKESNSKFQNELESILLEKRNMSYHFEEQKRLFTELKKKFGELKSFQKGLEERIQHCDSTISDLEGELKCKNSELQDRASRIKFFEEEVKLANLELKKTNEDKERSLNKVQDMIRDNEILLRRNEYLLDQNEELVHKCSNLELEQGKADRKMKSLYAELEKLRKWKREYDEELERQRMSKKAILYIPRRGDLVNMVVSDMSVRLISLFEQNKSGLEFEEVDSVSRIKPHTPVLVFCINASRLGTDVSNALTGIRVSPQIAVVVLHHKEQHALPNQSSERVLTSTEYKSIGGIFDMACLSSKGGLYECDMNTSAIRGLYEFIKQRNT